MAVSRLEEQVTDWRLLSEYDQPGRVLRNVALSGCESKNGYRYTEAALRRAVRLYDQKPVFLDHAEKPTEPASRSTRDLVGSVINPRFQEGRLRGDVRVLDTESGRTFLALVEANAPGVGMSHVVLARRSLDGASVEWIEDVISVDVVVRPATTSTFRESEEKRAPDELQDETSGASPTASASTGGTAPADVDRIGNGAIEELLPRVLAVLERVEAALSRAGGLTAAGTDVQDEAPRRRDANVPADRPVAESEQPGRQEPALRPRATSALRRETEGGFSRGAFVAAIRGR